MFTFKTFTLSKTLNFPVHLLAFAGRQDTNVIIVDWSAYSGFGRPINNPEEMLNLYIEVLFKEIPKAADDLADFINFLNEHNGIGFDDVVLISHSMGCHSKNYK